MHTVGKYDCMHNTLRNLKGFLVVQMWVFGHRPERSYVDDYEEWRYVPNFPEYVVSNFGHIKRTGQTRGRRPILRTDSAGDVCVDLHVDGERVTRKLARLVGLAFLELPPERNTIKYVDGDNTNCRLENLIFERLE